MIEMIDKPHHTYQICLNFAITIKKQEKLLRLKQKKRTYLDQKTFSNKIY